MCDCTRYDDSLPGEGHRCWDPYVAADSSGVGRRETYTLVRERRCEAMHWWIASSAPLIFDAARAALAERIVSWVESLSGEARYEPIGSKLLPEPHIKVSTLPGVRYCAKPGDWIMATDERIKLSGTNEFGYGSSTRWVRAFRVLSPAEFETEGWRPE